MTMDLKLKTKDGGLNPEAFSVHAEKLAQQIYEDGLKKIKRINHN